LDGKEDYNKEEMKFVFTKPFGLRHSGNQASPEHPESLKNMTKGDCAYDLSKDLHPLTCFVVFGIK